VTALEPLSVEELENAIVEFAAGQPESGIDIVVVADSAVAVRGDSSVESLFRDAFGDEIASGAIVFEAIDRTLRAVSSADGRATLITAPNTSGEDAEAYGVLTVNASGCVVMEYPDQPSDLVVFGHGTTFRVREGELEIVAVGVGGRPSGTQALGAVPSFGGGYGVWTEDVLRKVTGQTFDELSPDVLRCFNSDTPVFRIS